jgi:hypothetical protein
MHSHRIAALAGKRFIWAFFLLIFSNAIVITAAKYGALPGKPAYYYALIAFGLFVSAALSEGLHSFWNEKLFFGLVVVLAAIGLFMYRGDAGPDFGGKVLYPLYIPSQIGTAIWPVLNLATPPPSTSLLVANNFVPLFSMPPLPL